jgi:hypothetical protein
VAESRRQRRIGRWILIGIRCCAAAILVGLLASWAMSQSHRHGVVVDGWRRYAICGDAGRIELRYATRSDADFSTDPPSVKEVPFAKAGDGPAVKWLGPAVTTATGRVTVTRIRNWPIVLLQRSLWPQSVTVFAGGDVPVPKQSADGTLTVEYLRFGEETRVTVVPYWIPISAVAVLLGLSLVIRRRPPAGHCRRCGYDLRASPDRCPECGTPNVAARKS